LDAGQSERQAARAERNNAPCSRLLYPSISVETREKAVKTVLIREIDEAIKVVDTWSRPRSERTRTWRPASGWWFLPGLLLGTLFWAVVSLAALRTLL
jgi:hypothetical protein